MGSRVGADQCNLISADLFSGEGAAGSVVFLSAASFLNIACLPARFL
jgi:hypothetical protein